jgi:hypothetical protein
VERPNADPFDEAKRRLRVEDVHLAIREDVLVPMQACGARRAGSAKEHAIVLRPAPGAGNDGDDSGQTPQGDHHCRYGRAVIRGDSRGGAA